MCRWLIGGAADLSPSTKTNLTFEGAGSLEPGDYSGRNMHFGVREHAMGAIANGMALSAICAPTPAPSWSSPTICARRSASRRSWKSRRLRVHPRFSIGVGEDGPTHQPIEHLATLRAIPGLDTIRPGDANEVAAAWKVALSHTHEPTALILSRQALPTIDRSRYAAADGLEKGAYILADAADGDPEIILMATGSEVSLVVAAHEKLVADGVKSRVVSMPSWYLFEKQDAAYRDSVFPPSVGARLAVEQAGSLGWDRYVGFEGATITMSTFGASAPLAKLQEKFGFTLDNVVKVARELLGKSK
jgi:transketolase